MEKVKIQNPIVYNMTGAAKKIGVSYNTLYRMVKGGKIKAVNVAHTGTKPIFAITANDVEEYISNYNSLQGSTKGA